MSNSWFIFERIFLVQHFQADIIKQDREMVMRKLIRSVYPNFSVAKMQIQACFSIYDDAFISNLISKKFI